MSNKSMHLVNQFFLLSKNNSIQVEKPDDDMNLNFNHYTFVRRLRLFSKKKEGKNVRSGRTFGANLDIIILHLYKGHICTIL